MGNTTKIVNFNGVDFEVPTWAKWIAQDEDSGNVNAYEDEPIKYSNFYGARGRYLEVYPKGRKRYGGCMEIKE